MTETSFTFPGNGKRRVRFLDDLSVIATRPEFSEYESLSTDLAKVKQSLIQHNERFRASSSRKASPEIRFYNHSLLGNLRELASLLSLEGLFLPAERKCLECPSSRTPVRAEW